MLHRAVGRIIQISRCAVAIQMWVLFTVFAVGGLTKPDSGKVGAVGW